MTVQNKHGGRKGEKEVSIPQLDQTRGRIEMDNSLSSPSLLLPRLFGA